MDKTKNNNTAIPNGSELNESATSVVPPLKDYRSIRIEISTTVHLGTMGAIRIGPVITDIGRDVVDQWFGDVSKKAQEELIELKNKGEQHD